MSAGEHGRRVSGYTNWRGETSVRRIVPIREPFFGGNEWHPWPTWLLPAWDVDKKAEREFALSGFATAYELDARATITRLTAENEAAATYWEDETRKARAALETAKREGWIAGRDAAAVAVASVTFGTRTTFVQAARALVPPAAECCDDG